jgi:hypothetical protein
MRNSIIALVLIPVCAGLASAHAAPQRSTYAVTGQVSSSCALGADVEPLTVSTTVGANGKLDTSLNNKSWTISNVMCSGPSSIKVSAKALRRNQPNASVPKGQSQTANFTATASGWSLTPASITTGETLPIGTGATYTSPAQTQNSAKAGNITVTVNNFTSVVGSNGNGSKLVDGPYSATITVSLSPN